MTLLITAVIYLLFFFFHVEYDNSSEGDADNGGRNVDTADDDIDDFIDNAVAIVVLLIDVENESDWLIWYDDDSDDDDIVGVMVVDDCSIVSYVMAIDYSLRNSI